MKILVMGLLVISVFLLHGCGEKDAAVEKAVVTTTKKLSPEEKFLDAKRKAEQGDAVSQFSLGVMYQEGTGVSNNAAKAVEWVQKAAEQGLVDAQEKLGIMFNLGEGVMRDRAKALEWWQKAAAQYQKAADRGDAVAQYKLGEMYRHGAGVPKDAVKAVEWYQKSAAQGYAEAQLELGDMYESNNYGYDKGVPKDDIKAAEWYRKAAEQGHVKAQYYLGGMYGRGKGVPKDTAKQMEWYQKSAAQGLDIAQYLLGLHYEQGDGVPKDASKAVEWYQKAAAQGHSYAQLDLGRMYEDGNGVSKNSVLAYAWFNLAAAQENNPAIDRRNHIESRLSPSQRSEAERMSSNWKKGDILQAVTTEGESFTLQNSKISKQATGTAFFVSREGHALTNYHVVNTCKEIHVTGRNGVVNLVTSDSVNDLALLQVPEKNAEMALMNPDPSKLRQGEDVIVFGYPFNSVLSSGGNLTPGTLSALTGLGNNTNGIQITAPIQVGSSGSPVLDKKGNVIGVVSMKLNDGVAARATGQIPQNVNFAVNGQTTKAFLEANKVPYKTGGGFFSREKSNADIAEEARKWTVIVECWR